MLLAANMMLKGLGGWRKGVGGWWSRKIFFFFNWLKMSKMLEFDFIQLDMMVCVVEWIICS